MRKRLGRFFSAKPKREYDKFACETNAPFDREEDEESGHDGFRFAPELFEIRTEVIGELSERGFDWLSHYSSVDPIHDCYGIEVCGVRDRDDAIAIQRILQSMFPSWRPG